MAPVRQFAARIPEAPWDLGPSREAIALGWAFPLDVLVRTQEQIRIGLAESDFFVRDVMTNGATLFEAGDG